MSFCHVIKDGKEPPPVRTVKEVEKPHKFCGTPELVADQRKIREAAKQGIKRRTVRVRSVLP